MAFQRDAKDRAPGTAMKRDALIQLLDFLYVYFRLPVAALFLNGGPPSAAKVLLPAIGGADPGVVQSLLRLAAPLRPSVRLEELDVELLRRCCVDFRNDPARPASKWVLGALGLLDLVVPLELVGLDGARELLGVASVGKLLPPSEHNPVHDWLAGQLEGNGNAAWRSVLASAASEIRAEALLLEAASTETTKQLPARVTDAVAGYLHLLGSTPDCVANPYGEYLLEGDEASNRRYAVTEAELWKNLAEPLQGLANRFDLKALRLLRVQNRDYREVQEVARSLRSRKTVQTFSLSSADDLVALESSPWVELPTGEGALSWIEPATLLHCEAAALFARPMVGFNLVVAVAALDRPGMAQHRLASLYDALSARLFPYIETHLFALTLDDLMAETGHLMNRAVGQVIDGHALVEGVVDQYQGSAKQVMMIGLASIKHGSRRLRLIQHNFYSFAWRRYLQQPERSEGSELSLDPIVSTFDLVEFIRKLLTELGEEAEDRGRAGTRITVSPEARARPPRVKGSKEMLQVAVLNIFDNALKFSYRDTYIDVELDTDDASAHLCVSDYGVGIAADEREMLFRKGAQSRIKDAYRRTEGLGLGLALCKTVIEKMFGGNIAIDSVPAGADRFEGDRHITTVRISLPLAALKEQA